MWEGLGRWTPGAVACRLRKLFRTEPSSETAPVDDPRQYCLVCQVQNQRYKHCFPPPWYLLCLSRDPVKPGRRVQGQRHRSWHFTPGSADILTLLCLSFPVHRGGHRGTQAPRSSEDWSVHLAWSLASPERSGSCSPCFSRAPARTAF